MFLRSHQRFSKAVLYVLGMVMLTLGGAPAVAQEVDCGPDPFPPYVFILLDTSGSMNWAPPCSQAEIDDGLCSRLCAGPECFVPGQADSPDSKFFQIKSALYEALSSLEAEGVSFGFASFNQDTLYARSKHWLYEAAGDGAIIPGFGPFPPAGSREVLGATWTCDQGTGDEEVGCTPAVPADLTDAWELGRVRELAKGGLTFTSTISFYVRHQAVTYRVQYTPLGGTPGAAVSLRVRVERCLNASCSSRTLIGDPTLPYTPVSEFLVWQNGVSRTEPVGYFDQAATADVSAGNSCSGWDPNTDTTSDRFNGYSLRWPTVTDLRGNLFSFGDVIPLDWQTDHQQDIQRRLAPNVVTDPLAVPDFRSSPYLRDLRSGAETFLRLKNELVRPLLATGSTPLGNSLRSFRTWYAGCAAGTCPMGAGWYAQAMAQDPDFLCRRQNLILITDGEETCALDPCPTAAALYAQHGMRTWVVAYGSDPLSSQMYCMADQGGTIEPFFPRNPSELFQALQEIFVAASQP